MDADDDEDDELNTDTDAAEYTFHFVWIKINSWIIKQITLICQ